MVRVALLPEGVSIEARGGFSRRLTRKVVEGYGKAMNFRFNRMGKAWRTRLGASDYFQRDAENFVHHVWRTKFDDFAKNKSAFPVLGIVSEHARHRVSSCRATLTDSLLYHEGNAESRFSTGIRTSTQTVRRRFQEDAWLYGEDSED
jgi:hypothetical protein